MDTIKRNCTTINNWVETMKSLCGFNVVYKVSVYNTLSFERDKCCFEVVANSADIVAHFGEYFVYYVKTDKYGETDTPCLNLLICKNRPDEKYWTEYMKED
jgi:hypothetical protein|nr:MAG TPA: hypothetical protein [Caudoviricetes sp.]